MVHRKQSSDEEIPNDALLYLHISAILSHYQRIIPQPRNWWEQMQKHKASHYTERDKHRTLNGGLFQILPFRAQGSPRMRRQKECKRERGWWTPGEQVPLNQLSKTRTNSETKAANTEPAGSPPGLLHVCDSCQFNIPPGFLSIWMSGSLNHLPSLWLFPFCGFLCPTSMIWWLVFY